MTIHLCHCPVPSSIRSGK